MTEVAVAVIVPAKASISNDRPFVAVPVVLTVPSMPFSSLLTF